MAGDDEVVVEVQQVAKKFCRSLRRSLHYAIMDMAHEVVLGARRTVDLRRDEFWVLRGISLDVRRGEAIGIVGRNGAGKTTLLRIIAGLIRPDTGYARTRGRVAPLIALSAGFNPVLTGRENIFANMAILGLSTREIRARLDAVIAFADIEHALDAPTRTYSSGMTARLGFACAVHTAPDVLLVDEVLAVGDQAFRVKCYRKIAELIKGGTATILVSHNPVTILGTCSSAVYLNKGEVVLRAPPQEVLNRYDADVLGAVAVDARSPVSPQGTSSGVLRIHEVGTRDATGRAAEGLTTGEPGEIYFNCLAEEPVADLAATIMVREVGAAGQPILLMASLGDGKKFQAPAGSFSLKLILPHCCLRPGYYTMKASLARASAGLDILDFHEAFIFRVKEGPPVTECAFYQPRRWELEPELRRP
jgi:lipopolysaccharide transport system ATP-binding protein